MHFKDLATSPPGDWKYTQKESGFTMRAITFGALVGKVRTHRNNMKYPPVAEGYLTLSEEIQDTMCERMSIEDRVAHCEMGVDFLKTVNWKMVSRFLETMAKWFRTNGMKLVPQEEAERRAAICVKCPMNVGLGGCGVCRQALSAVRTTVFKATTSQDANLHACGVCGCDNKLSVHVPLDALKGVSSATAYPAWCWKAEPQS